MIGITSAPGPLAARIPIAEHLTQSGELPDSGFRLTATPVEIVGLGAFPARAFAVLGRRERIETERPKRAGPSNQWNIQDGADLERPYPRGT